MTQLLTSLAIIGGGFLSGMIGGDLRNYTDQLRIRYPFAIIPPNIVFPIVWTTLYYFYGNFLFETWSRANNFSLEVKVLSILGIVLNYAWTITFFKTRTLSLIIILIQIVVAFLTIKSLAPPTSTRATIDDSDSDSEKHKRYLAPMLIAYQVVYLCWLCFAALLNSQVL